MAVTACKMAVVTDGSGHNVTGLAVSVCITPAAPSPLPIPYPTMGTTAEGLNFVPMRTKIEGSKILNVGAVVKTCHGNEAGTLKEVVSLTTSGSTFPVVGAPIVMVERGMIAITTSLGFMNTLHPGAGACVVSGGGGDGGGGGGDGSGPSEPGGGGSGTGGSTKAGDAGSGSSGSSGSGSAGKASSTGEGVKNDLTPGGAAGGGGKAPPPPPPPPPPGDDGKKSKIDEVAPKKTPEEAAKECGMKPEHVQNLSDRTKENKELVVVRGSNPASVARQDEPGTIAKPVTEKRHTAKDGPNAGLVVDEAGNPVIIDGKKVHGDYDLQTVQKEQPDGKLKPVNSNDPAVQKSINDDVSPEKPMVQHGANDDYKKKDKDGNPVTDPRNGKPQMGRDPDPNEKFLVSEPDGTTRVVNGTDNLKTYYQEKGMDWPYAVPPYPP
jgi:hypothetical protein